MLLNQPVRVIAFGAHPDDWGLGTGGLAAKYAVRGDKVKFVSLGGRYSPRQGQYGPQQGLNPRCIAYPGRMALGNACARRTEVRVPHHARRGRSLTCRCLS